MRIAYIEIDTHVEVALNFVELLQNSTALHVDFYFSEKILNTLQITPSENIIETTADALLKDLDNADPYDAVIIGTVHRHFNIFRAVTKKFPTVIIAHNLNFIAASKRKLIKAIFKKDFKFRLKLLLKEGLLSKTQVYKQAKSRWVLDVMLSGHHSDYKAINIFFNKHQKNYKGNPIHIVIPGTVCQKRRDYAHIFDCIENEKIAHKAHFTFLGKAKGKVLNQLQYLQEKLKHHPLYNISYFKSTVDQTTFDDCMRSADYLWCPVQKETSFFSIPETYGKTKMSGNIGDAIKYGKWAIFPKFYQGQYPFTACEEVLLGAVELPLLPPTTLYTKEKTKKNLEQALIHIIREL